MEICSLVQRNLVFKHRDMKPGKKPVCIMICSRKWSCAIWRRWNGGSCLIQSLMYHREKFMCLSQSYKAVFDMNFPIPWITSVVVLCNASRFLDSCPREQGHEGWTSSTLLYAKALLRRSTWAGQEMCVERDEAILWHSHTMQMLWKKLDSMWWPPGSQIVQVISGYGS